MFRKLFVIGASLGALITIFVPAGATAGGGTGITATPASTQTFGTYSAKFVRSASGIINETSRVNSAGPQNPWSSLDVWVQFRPLTGPTGTGSPTPNPACEGSTVTPPGTYVNDQASLSGDVTHGYFIGTNRYNVCVYFVHTYATDLSIAPNPVIQGQNVVFTSHLLVDGTASATPTATIRIFPYGTDSTCTTPAGYGPFSTTQSGTEYTTVPLNTSASPGFYYYKAKAEFGTPTLTRWSACTALQITPHAYTLTLLADGQSSLDAVNVGDHVVYTGTAKDGTSAVAGAPVSFNVWTGTGCSGNPLSSGIVGPATDASGNYSFDGGPSPAGVYSVEAYTANATSNCVDVAVGKTAAVKDVTPSPLTGTFTCVGGVTGGTATSSTVYWYRNQATGKITVTISVVGAAASSTFDVWIEQNTGTCPPGTGTPSNPSAITTDGSGNGSATITFTPVAGASHFWLSMWTPAGSLTGTQVLRSVAVTL